MNEKKKWLVSKVRTEKAGIAAALSSGLSVSAVTAAVLCNRGLETVEDAVRFIRKETVLFHDPSLMQDMEKAVDTVLSAIRNGKKITIYGDYDVDGVTSVSALYLYLKSCGADVGYYIPNRNGEGYGINRTALDMLAGQGTGLMITVDTGITAVEETDYAGSLGMEVIITDHHECPEELPRASAVVNPKRRDCAYPFKELAGVGVVFKLICALEERRRRERGEEGHGYLQHICEEYIDLVAIGTISDVMPLMDENRLIVSMGLHIMEDTKRPGLAALLDMVGTKEEGKTKRKKKLTASYIGFVVAPKINAAGRLSSASAAVELFLTDSDEAAKRIVERLLEINAERQATESEILEDAYRKIAEEHDFENQSVIVLGGDGWHQGVIGIVASRITERYNLPSILISFDGDVGKGSGRSIKGMNLVDALRDSGDLLIKFGGHALAAGLSIQRDKLDEFKKKINDYAREHISAADTEITLDIDCEVYPREFNLSLAEELLCLEPYGISNPVPTFVMNDLEICDICGIGQNRHTRLLLAAPDGLRITGLCFGAAPENIEASVGDHVDAVFNMNVNEFQNQKSVQMIIKDLRFSERMQIHMNRQEHVFSKICAGEPLTQRECTGSIPCRQDFVLFYRFLRNEIASGRQVFSDTFFSSKNIGYPERLSMMKIKVMLTVFKQSGVITEESVPSQFSLGERYKISINETDKKFSLESSPLYRSVLKYGG